MPSVQAPDTLLPPLTGWTGQSGQPVRSDAGLQLIRVQGVQLTAGMYPILFYNWPSGWPPDALTNTGWPTYENPGPPPEGNIFSPLANVSVAGDAGDFQMDFQGLTGYWTVYMQIPGIGGAPTIKTQPTTFYVDGPAVYLVDANGAPVNQMIGAQGPSYADVVDVAATAAAGVTVLNANYQFVPTPTGGQVITKVKYTASQNAGVQNGGSPPGVVNTMASGPAQGGGIPASGVMAIPTVNSAVPSAAVRATATPAAAAPSSNTWLIVLGALVAIYVAWKVL